MMRLRASPLPALATLCSARLFADRKRSFQSQSNHDQAPGKDRFPPKAYDPGNPCRKLAVLVDAKKVDADVFCRAVEPVISEVGVPVLIRVFDYDLSPKWQSIVAGGLADSDAASTVKRIVSGPSIEWFRVERFIPISMQMGADANHIFEYRSFNRVEAVCYVCTELERVHFETLVNRLKGKGFNQYVFDELGLGLEINDDGRSKNGAPS